MNFPRLVTLCLVTIITSPILGANADCLQSYQSQLNKVEHKLQGLPNRFKNRAQAEQAVGVFTDGKNAWYNQSMGLSVNLGNTEKSLNKEREEYNRIIEMILNPESTTAKVGFLSLNIMLMEAGIVQLESSAVIQKFNELNKDEVICSSRPANLKKISKLIRKSL